MEGSRKRARRLLVVTATLAALATLTVASSGVAADQPVAIPGDETRTNYVPMGLRTGPETVIVQLSGKPVAITGAGKSEREKDKLAAELTAKQNSLRPSIEALGGQVISSFQWAYNGMKVSIPRSKLDELAKLSDVKGVHAAPVFERTHLNSVPLINAPAAWNGAGGKTGEGVKVAILDTGIDYTHANFGGPGTPEAFAAADATDTVEASPTLFGPLAPRIKGGIDLVGDAYDASADPPEKPEDPDARIPHPDPNPLDCNGHGSHVAGSAGGSGVLANGSTYTGSYGSDTFSTAFRIGPGVAPEADLYAVRVFGCLGSTNVVVEALDWAVENGMDVVNMSLGLTFGIPDSNPSAEASNNAAKAGVVVVASAGNSGPSQYIGGTPGTALRTISVAANDSVPSTPGASLALSTGGAAITAINANGATFSNGLTLPLKVLKNPDGTMKRGCNHPDAPEDLRDANDEAVPNDYVDVAGKVVVVQRGTCARVARAVYGQKEGAAAVIMVNNSTSLPPFEGPIKSNADTGEPFNVTIPFIGVRGLAATAGTDGNRLLVAPDGTSMTLTNQNLVNTGYKGFASFTSGGPRQGDSILKPDVTAPGVSILSTGVGTGSEGAFVSGTSMASPHVAGLAALVNQAHPAWSVEEVKAAVVSTADPAGVVGTGAASYRTSRGGAGFVNANAAANTAVTAFGDDFTSSLSFGFVEVDKDAFFEKTKQIKLRNYSSQPITFDVSAVLPQGSPHSVQLSKTQVTVPENGGENVDVRLVVPSATMGSSSAYREVAGLVKFTPTSGANGGIALHVPYLLVPRPLSHVQLKLEKNDFKPNEASTTTATVSNIDGTIGSSADFYAWGLEDGSDGLRFNDVRAVGAQAFDAPTAADPGRRFLVFAVNMWRPWSHASVNEVDIFVDVGMDGTDDYVVVMADLGLLTTGSFDGQPAVGVFSLTEGSPGGSIAFLASAPTDSSTMLLTVRIGSSSAAGRQLCRTDNPATPVVEPTEPCLSAANPRFSYHVETFGLRLAEDDSVPGVARFNAWSSSISQGDFVPLARNATVDVPLSVNAAEWAQTPAKGAMVVSRDNRNGQDEARTVEVKVSD
jgi:minor extracellular serine protease Vpr